MTETRHVSLTERVADLERQVDVLTRALHLTFVGVKPALDWLDKKTGVTP